MLKRFLVACGVLAVAAIPSFANIGFSVPPSSPVVLDWGPGDPVNLGMVFSPTANISVTSLGTYYQASGFNLPGQTETDGAKANSRSGSRPR